MVVIEAIISGILDQEYLNQRMEELPGMKQDCLGT